MSRDDLVNYVIIFGIIMVSGGILGLVLPGVACFLRPDSRRWVVVVGFVLALGLFSSRFVGTDPDGDLGREGVFIAGTGCAYIVIVWAISARVGAALGRRRASRSNTERSR